MQADTNMSDTYWCIHLLHNICYQLAYLLLFAPVKCLIMVITRKRLKKDMLECSLDTSLNQPNACHNLQVGAPDVSADDQEKINSFNKRWQRLKEINAELEGKKVCCIALKTPHLLPFTQTCNSAYKGRPKVFFHLFVILERP